MVIAVWEVLAFATLTDLCRKVNILSLQRRDEFEHVPARRFSLVLSLQTDAQPASDCSSIH